MIYGFDNAGPAFVNAGNAEAVSAAQAAPLSGYAGNSILGGEVSGSGIGGAVSGSQVPNVFYGSDNTGLYLVLALVAFYFLLRK